ncbi:M10 family metallopeptidase C-terminal domain-containing protein [Pseudoduganella chitinolytica]|uniref:M10 family metallopeptidase C-terminal domain-containing protein n=1 Tax=Pseudoduganella chitinolytica TaxID=34070 RepID=A0ABY8BFY9_9BURK|nr:M10 family metallopeptidase C-terminal domain-containing protein [Pseudoduganella chitinolytica]WEF34601.1 M10 family metallopeptidase C-terminal domain-containing protein [Pseudoduganella chitinolytica]
MSSNTGNNSLDSLVYGSWYGQLGTPVQLTYSFLTRAPVNASAEDRNGFVAMSATQQAAVRDALAKWASVTNLTFTETVRNTGNLQFGTNDQGDSSSAYAYLPEAGVSTLAMYTNNQDAYNSVFTPGTYGPAVLLHEIGHLLGLKHPGNYDSTGSTIDGPFLPEATDNGDYTQMSYNEPSSWAINRHYATTPMLYDIQAIQYLYGANMSWHAGTDVYTFTNSVAPQCIWDAGGDNTFDFSGCTGATIINLNAGSFSETAPGLNNVSIAYGVTVRTAIAGAGGATIYANDLGNVLRGGQGTDVFHEGGGNDTVDGGDGADTVVFEGTYAQHAVLRAAGAASPCWATVPTP